MGKRMMLMWKRSAAAQFYVQSGVMAILERGRAGALICWQMAFHYLCSEMVQSAKDSGTKTLCGYKSSSTGILQRFPLPICLMCLLLSLCSVIRFPPNTAIIKEFERAQQWGTIELELHLHCHLEAMDVTVCKSEQSWGTKKITCCYIAQERTNSSAVRWRICHRGQRM